MSVMSALQPRIDEQRRKIQELTDTLQADEKMMVLAQDSTSTSEIGRLTAEHQLRQRELETEQNHLLVLNQRLAEITAPSARGPDGSLPPVIETAATPPAEGDYISTNIPRELGLGFLRALGCGLAAAGLVTIAGKILSRNAIAARKP
jgi:hypothetical protein